MERTNPSRYVLIYFGAILCFALSGAFVKYSALGPCATAFYRMLFSIPLLLPFVWQALPALSRRDILLLLGGGLLLGMNLALWNYGLVCTSQANANLLGNLHIFATVPLSLLFYQEKIRRAYLLGVAVAMIGLALLIFGKADPRAGYFLGDGAAFLSALFYGGYMMVTYAVRDRVSAWAAIWVSAFGCLIFLFPAMALLEGLQFPDTWPRLWPILMIMLAGQFGGIGLMSLALGRIRATLGSLLSLTQPVAGALLGFILFSERLTGQEIIGMLICSAGVYLAQRRGPEAPRPQA